MKFNCGKTREAKETYKVRWRSWFAWFPVKIGDHECVWLEMVERRLDLSVSASYEYRQVHEEFV